MSQFAYTRSIQYTDLDLIYSESSGPGGLHLTEFMSEKMQLRTNARLLDIGWLCDCPETSPMKFSPFWWAPIYSSPLCVPKQLNLST